MDPMGHKAPYAGGCKFFFFRELFCDPQGTV